MSYNFFWKTVNNWVIMKEELKNQVNDEIERLNETQQKMFADFAVGGYLEQLAMILAYMEDSYSSECLKTYPESLRELLAEKMKKYNVNDGKCQLAAARVLHDFGFSDENFSKYREIVKKQPLEEVDLLNLQMEEKNPLLCASLCNINKYCFEELADIDDRAFQKILREVDNQTLAMSLKSTTEEMLEKVFKNMSTRAYDMLREDMEFMGPVRLSDVLDSKSKIVAIFERLLDAGEIIYSRSGEQILV